MTSNQSNHHGTTKLQVETAELRDLAATQSDAAGDYGQNATATSGTGSSVFSTHGIVCSATAMAVGEANSARASAASAMQTVSTGLAENLETAASAYDHVDSQYQDEIDHRMRTDCF